MSLPSWSLTSISPTNTRRDIESKLDDYRRVGVLECWLVSPEAETIGVLRRPEAQFTTTAIFGMDGTLSSEVLSDFSLPIRELFR